MWTVASYVYFQIYKIDKIYKKFQNWHNLALLTFLALCRIYYAGNLWEKWFSYGHINMPQKLLRRAIGSFLFTNVEAFPQKTKW